MGRIYIPQEDMARFGYSEEMLADGTFNREFRDLLAFEVERTRDLFRHGLKLVDTLEGRLKLDVALFSLGGMRVLDAIEKQGYDVLGMRPKISRPAKLRLMLTTALRLKMGFGV
jgi:phytoene/squalene synthetase